MESMTRSRFRIWPAALIALVGFVGAGAVATQAASSTDAPTCGPAAEAPAWKTSTANFSGATSLRLASNSTETGTDTTKVCVTVDPAELDLQPANPNI